MMNGQKIESVSVIGLGKLGSPMVAAFALRGYRVTGVDVAPDIVDKVNRGVAPVQEPGLQALLHETHPRVKATCDYAAAIRDSEITFIIVPTPTDESGGFSNRCVLAAADRIGQGLAKLDRYHLVVVTSTVLPGSMNNEIVPALEGSSGKECGVDFGVCYNPEFIALGSVIHDIMNPDMVLVGESDPRAGDILTEFYGTVCENEPPIARMNFINAELAKISLNTYVTTKISYANMIGEICEQLPEADVDVVTNAVGLDSRVGRAYFQAGTRYGGPCFPRDNRALGVVARKVGVVPTLSEATESINIRQHQRLVDILVKRLPPKATVAVLGLAYKTGTGVVEESQGVALAKALLERGFSVTVYDPLAMDNARNELGHGPVYASSTTDCVAQADAVVVTLPDETYHGLNPDNLANKNPRRVLILDCWRFLEAERFKPAVDYVAPGLGPEDGTPDIESSELDSAPILPTRQLRGR